MSLLNESTIARGASLTGLSEDLFDEEFFYVPMPAEVAAAGAGSLTLSAAGAVNPPAAGGSASLTLTGSATAAQISAPVPSGSASLTLSASGSNAGVRGVAQGGSASLSLSAYSTLSNWSKAVLDSTPYAYWRLAERSGTVAADWSGGARDATYGGITGTDFGQASMVPTDPNATGILINATSDNVSATFDFQSNNFTAMVVLKGTGVSGINPGLFSTQSPGNYLSLPNGGNVGLAVNNTTQVLTPAYPVASLYDGNPHLLVYVMSANLQQLWVDGVMVASATQPFVAATRASIALKRSSLGPGNGTYQDFAVWDRPLTSGEVGLLYNAYSGTTIPVAAAGTASLTLSATGAAAGLTPAAGSASLSLSASGAASGIQPAAGTASLTLTAGSSQLLTSYNAQVMADAPVLYYKLDDAYGLNAVVDSSGHGYHSGLAFNGILAQPPLINGWGSSAFFDGDNDVIQSPAIPELVHNTTLNKSYETWFKTDAFVNFQLTLADDNILNGLMVKVNRDAGSSEKVSAQWAQSNSNVWLDSTATVTDGLPHHIVVTLTPTTMTLYVDGVSQGTLAATGTVNGTSPEFYFGTTTTLSFDHYGWLDEIALYDRTLSPERVAAHYAAGIAATPPVSASVAGTASLSLSASGAMQARLPSSTASLTLSATGTAASPSTGSSGTAALTLSASGAGRGAVAGSASLDLTATGAARAPVAGAASLALSASGGASASPAGSAALTLTASGAARAAGAGSAALTLSASGAGRAPSTGSASLTLTASGAGRAPVTGTASLSLAASGAAAAPVAGSASLSLSAEAVAGALIPSGAAVPVGIAERKIGTGNTCTLLSAPAVGSVVVMALSSSTAGDQESQPVTYTVGSATGTWQKIHSAQTVAGSTGTYLSSHDVWVGIGVTSTDINVTCTGATGTSHTPIFNAWVLTNADATSIAASSLVTPPPAGTYDGPVMSIPAGGVALAFASIADFGSYTYPSSTIPATGWSSVSTSALVTGWARMVAIDRLNSTTQNHQISATVPNAATHGHRMSQITASPVAVAAGNVASLTLSASGNVVAAVPASGDASLTLSASGAGAASSAGSAALALTASGSGAAPVSATASLTLTASGAARAPVTGTASLSLLASGSGAAGVAGAASLDLTASGESRAASTATAALALTASGAGSGALAGSAALSLAASGSSAASTAGSAALTLTGSGTTGATSGGSASISLTGSGTTRSPVAGSASITLSAGGDLDGSLDAAGTAMLSLTASGSTRSLVGGSASLSLTGSGGLRAVAAGTASIVISASGAASTQAAAAGSGSISLTGSGSAAIRTTGSGSIDLTAAGATSSPSAGDAALSLSAVGASAGRAAGEASLDLVAEGGASITVGGTASLDLTADLSARADATALATLTLFAGGIAGLPEGSPTYYADPALLAAERLGWWDGTDVRPVVLLGVWTGTTTAPIEALPVT